MKTFVSTAAALLAAILMAACGGGGGGGSSSAPAPSGPAPTASLLSVSPATGETIKANAIDEVTITVELTVTDATKSDASKISLQCDNAAITFTSTSSLSGDGKTMAVTLAPAATSSLVGATYQCTMSGDVVTTGPGGTVPTTISTSFSVASTCTAPAVWTQGINTCVTPIGVLATGFYQLPAGCTQATQACFTSAVSSLSAADSGGTDSTGGHVTWLAFRNTTVAGNVTGLWNILPFHTKDGTRAGTNNPDISGGYTVELDAFWGSEDGVIIRQKDTMTCSDISVAGSVTRTATPVACPQ